MVCHRQLALPFATAVSLPWLLLSRPRLAAGSCSSEVVALGALAPSSVTDRAEGGLAEAAASPCNHFMISIYIFASVHWLS